VVLGRSREGVTYGVPGSPVVNVVVLLVIGKPHRQRHLELLAPLAELLQSEDLRDALIHAKDVSAIRRLLRQSAGVEPESQWQQSSAEAPLNVTMVRQAIQLVDALSAQALLLAVDSLDSVPWQLVAGWRRKLLIVTADAGDDLTHGRQDTHLFHIPHTGLSRRDRANVGLLLAASSGLLDDASSVVCVTGPPGPQLDSVTVTRPDGHLHHIFTGKSARRGNIIRPEVLLRVLSLAVELANEGREGRPVGTMFVVGDSRHVLRCAQQLVLNPFHGFSRTLRNVLDPSLAETIKEFAQIDGAFIIKGDGMVLTAGAYLAPKASATGLPSGLGARHITAAGITAHTSAMALTVSQSTGTVTIFRKGNIITELECSERSRW
jgi:DNA integrity scanning protein DisA with diadenylate cyclase activity